LEYTFSNQDSFNARLHVNEIEGAFCLGKASDATAKIDIFLLFIGKLGGAAMFIRTGEPAVTNWTCVD